MRALFPRRQVPAGTYVTYATYATYATIGKVPVVPLRNSPSGEQNICCFPIEISLDLALPNANKTSVSGVKEGK